MALAVPSTVPVWAALFPRTISTYYVVGQRYISSGNIYTVTTAGTTSSGAGPSTTGSGISDGSAVVAYVSSLAPAWVVASYGIGARVTSSGSIYQVVNAGPGTSTVPPIFTPPASLANPLQFNTSDGYTWVWCASSSAVITAPTAYQTDVGWVPGMLPPAQIMDFLQYWTGKWLLWLQDLPNQAITWLALQTFNKGVVITASTGIALDVTGVTGQHAAQFTGVGVGEGVVGIGGATGIGIKGIGGATTGTGVGVRGDGGTTGGQGGYFQANGGSTNGSSSQGSNAGAGAFGQGGATGPGVRGVGGGTNGPGGRFEATAGNSNGVEAVPQGSGSAAFLNPSDGTGYGLEVLPNSTRAPLHLGTLPSAPSSGVSGDVYYDSSLNKLRVFGLATWETITSV